MGELTKRAAADVEAAKAPTAKDVLQSLIMRNKDSLSRSLPRGMDLDRYLGLLITAATTNPDLLKCDPVSFVRAALVSAKLGLEVNDPRGDAYLIPYGKQVQFQLGYRGMLKLARRSGHVAGFGADCVYEGDEFEWENGLVPKLFHKRHGEDNPSKITHAWAKAVVDGEPEFVVMFRSEIDKVRKRAKASTGPWETDFAEMAIKTVYKRLAKRLPMEADAAYAVAVDDQPDVRIMGFNDDVIDVDEWEVVGGEVAAVERPPEGVDAGTGEVLDVESTEDDGRPF